MWLYTRNRPLHPFPAPHRFICRSKPHRHVNRYKPPTSVYMSYDVGMPSYPIFSANTSVYMSYDVEPTPFSCHQRPRRVGLHVVRCGTYPLHISVNNQTTSVYMSKVCPLHIVGCEPYRFTYRPMPLTCRTMRVISVYISVDAIYMS